MAVKRSERKFKDGETIFREGETSDAAYVVVDGTVDLVKTGERKPVRLATLEAGDLFGEMGVIDHGPRNATAVAVGPVTVKVIEREDFVRSVQDKPDMALDVMSMLVRRLRAADEMVAFGRATKPSAGGGGSGGVTTWAAAGGVASASAASSSPDVSRVAVGIRAGLIAGFRGRAGGRAVASRPAQRRPVGLGSRGPGPGSRPPAHQRTLGGDVQRAQGGGHRGAVGREGQGRHLALT